MLQELERESSCQGAILKRGTRFLRNHLYQEYICLYYLNFQPRAKTMMYVDLNKVIYFFFKLGYSCFTMLCQFLLYNKVNQLYVHICPLPLGPPPHPPSHPSRSSQSTELSSLRHTAGSHQLSVLHMAVHIRQFQSPSSSHPPSPCPVCPHVPYICVSIPALQIGSSVPFFQSNEFYTTAGHNVFVFCFFKLNYLFIYLWLWWVFVSVRGLSLVAASVGHSSSRCAGLSSWPLFLRSTGCRRAGSVVVAHGPSCSAACGIFPDQGSNPRPLHWQADSQPLRHQGSSGHNV